jgi:RNA polymerase sigma-54 factor
LKLGLHQTARMEQRLIQSPQMIQAMQILQLPALDLEERIEQELIENPFLEVAEAGDREEDGESAPQVDLRGEEPVAQGSEDRRGIEGMLDVLERYERDFGGNNSRSRRSWDDEGDRKMEAMANTPDRARSLADALIEQLAFLDLDERQRHMAEYLIYSLDHRGLLTQPLEEIAAELAEDQATVEELADLLIDLRRLIHPALGAHNLRETLLLQLDENGVEDPLVRAMVENHLDDIVTNRLPRIAKATGRTIAEVKDALETIRALDPTPGHDHQDAGAAAILPDVVVEEVDGRFEVRLTRARIPDLTISPAYKHMLRQARRGDGVQEWVKKRLESARWFIEAIVQRQSTLERIANCIFERQREFLERGVRALKPLRMQEVADQVGVHISTVSRAVSGKYVQTPRGTHPLKYFFTGGTQTESGGVESQASIKQRIRELVEQEDPKNPLSDDQIAELLELRDQVKIARRTVTKYRKALSIPSSSQRRMF